MMAGQTKMIIITSDEDLIRRLSSNKTDNTRIVDLDNNKQLTSMNNNDNNIMDLAILTELSELNPKNDQIFKRALNSPHHGRSKQVKLSKKSLDLDCAICGDRAIGFNYDVLSCASCKAFFRRNANQSLEKIRCLTGHGKCSVAHDSHRKCPRCRLDRCLNAGMRKDFIRTEEEKQRRKQRLEENRTISMKRSSTSESTNSSLTSPPVHIVPKSQSHTESFDEIDRLLMDMNKDNNNIVQQNDDINGLEDMLFGTLSIEDWLTIENVRSLFVSNFQNKVPLDTNSVTDQTSGLVVWSHWASQMALQFIKFFGQIDEFEKLNDEDRFILIKFNIYSMFPLFKCYMYKSVNDFVLSENKACEEKHSKFIYPYGTKERIHENFYNLILSFFEITEQDPTLVSLLMLIFIFTQGLAVSENQPPLQDELAVYRAQNHYIELLWNYLINKKGETYTYKYFNQLILIIFRMQIVSKQSQDFFRQRILASNAIDKMAPLMQTFLNIS
ncbi:unnamed protein product [Adineta steineri]|uniref:Uncharacterized protein n=4 Tax=Adineta steineri TaxID=433720 RepID=A0A815RK30_9BILA|nr:unnamed protein product [Adineta steineri]CAF4207937.1 unnamed protein product [Adineta steineri]